MDRVEVVADAAADEVLYGAVVEAQPVGHQQVGDRGQRDHAAEPDRVQGRGRPQGELAAGGVADQHVAGVDVDQVGQRVERRTDVRRA